MATNDTSKNSSNKSTKAKRTVVKTHKVMSSNGKDSYAVNEYNDNTFDCACPAYQKGKGADCKHIKGLKAGASLSNTNNFQPASKGSALSNLLSGKVAAPVVGAKSKSKEKSIIQMPSELLTEAEVFVADKMIQKDISSKAKVAAGKILDYCTRWFADAFAVQGKRPASSVMLNGRAKFDFIPTSRIHVNPARVEAARAVIGDEIDNWTEIKGVTFNYGVIVANNLQDKFEEAIRNMGLSDELLAQVLQPKHELKKGFFDDLHKIVGKTLQRGENLSDKMYMLIKALDPVKQVKNADLNIDGESREDRLANALRLILEAKISGASADFEESDDE